jgi:WD40 repeat protein
MFWLDPSGTFAVAGNAEGVSVYGLRGGEDRDVVRATDKAFDSGHVSPDGTVVAVTIDGGLIEFYETSTGDQITPAPPATSVAEAGFDSAGLFVYGGIDPATGSVLVNGWDVAAGSLAYSVALEPVDEWPLTFQVSPDGERLVGIRRHGNVDVWDLRSGAVLGTTRTIGPVNHNMVFVDDRIVAFGRYDGSILLYDLDAERPIRPLETSGGGIVALATSSDRQRLVSLSAGDDLIRVWQPDDHGLIMEPVADDRSIVALSDDGSRYLVVDESNVTEVWSTDGTTPPKSVPATADPKTFYNQTLSRDGRWLTQAGQENLDVPGPVRVVEVDTGQIVWSDESTYFDIGVTSADGKLLYLLDFDAEEPEGLSVLELPSGNVLTRLDESAMTRFGGSVWDLSPSADGRWLDLAGFNGSLWRLDADTLDTVEEIPLPFFAYGHRGGSADGTQMYAVGTVGSIGRIDLDTGAVTWGRSPEPTDLTHAVLSPDGTLIAALNQNSGTIALFEAETLRPLGRPIPIRLTNFGALAFTADGGLMVNGPYGMSRIELDPDVWEATACRAAGRNLTEAEWSGRFGDEPYRATCPGLPSAIGD